MCTFHCGCVNLNIFPLQTKVTIGYENFIIIPDGSRPNFQVHVTREHIDALSQTVINFTRCITESVLIALDIFPDVHSAVHNVSKLFKNADCAVSALAVLPSIPDLAEAWELRIKYA